MSDKVKIPVTINSGKNHGRTGNVVDYSKRKGGYLVQFDSEQIVGAIHDAHIVEIKKIRKHYYSLNRLSCTDADRIKLLILGPDWPGREKKIAQMVAAKLAPRNKYPMTETGRITYTQPSLHDLMYNVCVGKGIMKLEGK